MAPEGWHVPSDAEWTILINYLGGTKKAGGKMKSTGTLQSGSGLWYEPNTRASNSSGFTALPAGYRYFSGAFNFIDENAFFWSSSKSISRNAFGQILYYDDSIAYRSNNLSTYGLSVRCVKGFAVGIGEPEDMRGLKIYPNPVKDQLFIETGESRGLNLSIFNLPGELIMQKSLPGEVNEIDLGSLPRGMYILQLTAPDRNICRKLVKD
jgi:hypothetical protein